ncbi:hypothetical protein PGH47_43050 (plasmid) [Streptomyces sp. HUAS 31]|uniref:hypothetical protein n=1 Tax=Streptomyces sp. HUAS 31 TaxID=3020055 RepID=UPI002304D209|nr:hypothetical protein [Streptomyces sp. HUAS 31]WCE02525.1 hypothetical protein PGH47_43050 [Streptomyces sp. HUAS 31]
MNEQITRDGPRSTSATLQMPQQAPPVDRSQVAGGIDSTPGVEASIVSPYLFDIHSKWPGIHNPYVAY